MNCTKIERFLGPDRPATHPRTGNQRGKRPCQDRVDNRVITRYIKTMEEITLAQLSAQSEIPLTTLQTAVAEGRLEAVKRGRDLFVNAQGESWQRFKASYKPRRRKIAEQPADYRPKSEE
jgi:hypothetical protein